MSTTSHVVRVLLLGVGAPVSLAGALADGMLQDKYKGKLELTVFSRPLTGDATDAKKAAVTSLTSRGVKIINGDATQGAAAVAPLFKGFDVVVSSIGTSGMKDQRVYIEAAKQAGVPWFIPSTFGFDYQVPDKGNTMALLADPKAEDLAAIKAAGMNWTIFNTGAFAEYSLKVVLGVDQETKTIVFPQSGAASLTHTPLTDVGNIVADAIVTERGRNQVIYTAAATYTYEEFAQLLEKVTGSAWKRVIRPKAESEAVVRSNPYAFISVFELVIGTNPPNPACSWPVAKTYNYHHKIPMQSMEELVRKRLKV